MTKLSGMQSILKENNLLVEVSQVGKGVFSDCTVFKASLNKKNVCSKQLESNIITDSRTKITKKTHTNCFENID